MSWEPEGMLETGCKTNQRKVALSKWNRNLPQIKPLPYEQAHYKLVCIPSEEMKHSLRLLGLTAAYELPDQKWPWGITVCWNSSVEANVVWCSYVKRTVGSFASINNANENQCLKNRKSLASKWEEVIMPVTDPGGWWMANKRAPGQQCLKGLDRNADTAYSDCVKSHKHKS